ncbi:MAG: hypothetical protein ACPG4T_24110, partial [Nannocystaceae bacterium]
MRIFGVVPTFGQERIEVAYTNPEAELIELGRPQSLTSHLDTHAEVLLAELAEESLTERVKRAVYAGMANRHVSIRAVARTLGMSSRTLQRRLRHEQLTYR